MKCDRIPKQYEIKNEIMSYLQIGVHYCHTLIFWRYSSFTKDSKKKKK